MANEKPTVTIIYNGLEKSLEYNPEATVRTLLDHAIKAFGIGQNPHLLALFNQTGAELQDNQSAEAAGIKPGDRLLLRPSAVRGGRKMDRYTVPRAIVASTFDKVRECGAGHRECQVLWIGPWDEPMAISEAVHPQHRSHSSGFDVEGDWLNAFWLELAAKKAGVRAQVHTHPGRAFHSATDDKFPIIHVPGFLSLVIPDFGIGPVTFDGVYLAELTEVGDWKNVPATSRFEIV